MSESINELEKVFEGEVVPDEGWRENEAGLPVFEAFTPHAVESAWADLESQDGSVQLMKGAVASEVSRKAIYGDHSLETFAKTVVKRPYSTVKRYMGTHRRIEALEIDHQWSILHSIKAGTLTATHVYTCAAIEENRAFMAVLARAEVGWPRENGRYWKDKKRGSSLSVAETARCAKPILEKQRKKELAAAAEGNPKPGGVYTTLVIDPPWQVQDIEREERHLQHDFDYPTMNEDELEAWGKEFLKDVAAADSHLYLWTTHKHLPSALRLAEAWGFKYQCVMTWVKNVGITPFSWMYSTELVLFCRKGSLDLRVYGKRLDFNANVRQHSRKPDEFYELVCEASPGPRIDVFSRENREGFDSWGNERGRFSA